MNLFSTVAAATIVIYGTLEHGIWSPSHPQFYPIPMEIIDLDDNEPTTEDQRNLARPYHSR